MYITRAMLQEHGATPLCTACALGTGAHSPECRARFEKQYNWENAFAAPAATTAAAAVTAGEAAELVAAAQPASTPPPGASSSSSSVVVAAPSAAAVSQSVPVVGVGSQAQSSSVDSSMAV